MTNHIINVENLNKIYSLRNSNISILENVNFKIKEGNIISIMGPSGCGKSTFLNIIGMLDSEFGGIYHFLNKNVIRTITVILVSSPTSAVCEGRIRKYCSV